jgi:hypothetical protein
VDEQEIRVLGVEMAFWIAVSLAYLDYLHDRDVSSPPHSSGDIVYRRTQRAKGYLAASD